MACNFNHTAIIRTILEMSDNVDVDIVYEVYQRWYNIFESIWSARLFWCVCYVRDHFYLWCTLPVEIMLTAFLFASYLVFSSILFSPPHRLWIQRILTELWTRTFDSCCESTERGRFGAKIIWVFVTVLVFVTAFVFIVTIQKAFRDIFQCKVSFSEQHV